MRSVLLRSTALALALAVPSFAGAAFAQSADKNPELADPLEENADAPSATDTAGDAAAETPPAPPAPAATDAAPAPERSAAEDDPGAQRIRDALAPYVTQALLDQRVLTVAKEGEGFRITVDPAPLTSQIDPAVGRVTMPPYSMLVSERRDGTWDVTANDPISVEAEFEVEGQRTTFDYDIGTSTFTGVWSNELGTFTSGNGRMTDITMRQTDPQSVSESSSGSGDYTMEARATGVGEADMEVRQTIDAMTQRIESKEMPEAGMPAFTADFDMGRTVVESRGTAVRSRPMLDLWAFLVSRIDSTGDKIKADQEELRAKIRALLPVWRNINGAYDMADLKVTTPFGGGSAGRASQFMSIDGITGGGSYTWRFDLEDLSVQSPFLPEWTAGLLPQDMRLSISARNVDFKTPVDILVAEFDLNDPNILPPAAVERITTSFSDRPPTIVIDPGFVRGKDYEITYESTIEIVGPDQADTRSLVTARGLDAIVASLQKVGTPEANSAVGGINFAKGFGQALPDGRTRWEVETKADGAVLINGFQLVAPTVPGPSEP